MGLGEITGKVIESLPFGGDGLNLTSLPPDIISRVAGLITILKAAGIIFIGYVIFLIFRSFFTFKKYKVIKKMNKKINEIDEKLDILLRDKKLKFDKEKTEKELSKKEIKRKTKEIKKIKKKKK